MDKNQLQEQLTDILATESLVLTPVNIGMKLELDSDMVAGLMDELVGDGQFEKVSGAGAAAVYRQKGKSMVTTTPGTSSVGAAKSSKALYHGLLCVFLPGIASLIYGRFGWAIVELLLIGIGVYLLVAMGDFSKFFALIPFFVAWIVSMVGGYVVYANDPFSAKK